MRLGSGQDNALKQFDWLLRGIFSCQRWMRLNGNVRPPVFHDFANLEQFFDALVVMFDSECARTACCFRKEGRLVGNADGVSIEDVPRRFAIIEDVVVLAFEMVFACVHARVGPDYLVAEVSFAEGLV